jgi:prepilin-type N-terminal cleavage/methylation domain-containing protein
MKRAFSLVELLVTITVIAIVAGLGLLAFIQSRDNARKNTLQARIRQFNIAKEQYISEFGRLQSEIAWTNAGLQPSPSNARYNLLKRYIERPQQNIAEVVPEGCTLVTPKSVHGLYTGVITLDNVGPPNNKLAVTNGTGGVY